MVNSYDEYDAVSFMMFPTTISEDLNSALDKFSMEYFRRGVGFICVAGYDFAGRRYALLPNQPIKKNMAAMDK